MPQMSINHEKIGKIRGRQRVDNRKSGSIKWHYNKSSDYRGLASLAILCNKGRIRASH